MSHRISLGQERRAWARYIETGEADPRAGRNKFGAVPTEVNGRKHDSGWEAERAVQLEWLLKLGNISKLQYQVRFEIVPKQIGERAAHYIADFTYLEEGRYVTSSRPKKNPKVRKKKSR